MTTCSMLKFRVARSRRAAFVVLRYARQTVTHYHVLSTNLLLCAKYARRSRLATDTQTSSRERESNSCRSARTDPGCCPDPSRHTCRWRQTIHLHATPARPVPRARPWVGKGGLRLGGRPCQPRPSGRRFAGKKPERRRDWAAVRRRCAACRNLSWRRVAMQLVNMESELLAEPDT